MGEFSWNGHPLDSLLYRLGSGTATREDQSRAYSELKAATEEAHRLREQLRVAREGLKWYAAVVSDCNRRSELGTFARAKLAKDIGKRARDTLARIDALKEDGNA